MSVIGVGSGHSKKAILTVVSAQELTGHIALARKGSGRWWMGILATNGQKRCSIKSFASVS
jgi:hypothetical protein